MKTKLILSFLFITLLVTIKSSAQISTDSLLLDMPMDGNANDLSGNNNNGIIHNAVADTNRFGVPNKAFRFNGIDSYIEIPASPSLNRIQTSNVISISAWVNIFQWWNNVNVFSIFERYNPATDAGWLFEANWVGGGLLFLADETSTTNWVGATYAWNFHEWHYLALTYDHAQGIANFYVDSTLVGSVPYTASIFVADTTAPFVIGRSLAGPDEYSDGLIDDYKIYNRVLTPTEITNIFTTGLGEHSTDNSFAVYPNPVIDMVTINTKSAVNNTNYFIVDVPGKILKSGKLQNGITNIDLSDLSPGVYFLYSADQSFKLIKF